MRRLSLAIALTTLVAILCVGAAASAAYTDPALKVTKMTDGSIVVMYTNLRGSNQNSLILFFDTAVTADMSKGSTFVIGTTGPGTGLLSGTKQSGLTNVWRFDLPAGSYCVPGGTFQITFKPTSANLVLAILGIRN